MTDLVEIENPEAPAKHEPFSDYKPKDITAEELKLAGVTILGEQDSMLILQCDICGSIWHIGDWPDCKECLKEPPPSHIQPYWQCINTL